MFFRKKKVEQQAKNFDKLITWLIIGSAVAWMIWLSKTEKWKEVTKTVTEKWKDVAKDGVKVFWKVLVWVIKIFNNKDNNNQK